MAEEEVKFEELEDIYAPYKGEFPFVFVSYSHDDPIVIDVIHGLIDKGYRIWYDAGIHHGDWSEQIEEKVESCRAFVVFLSKNSVESKYVNREIFQYCNKGEKKEITFIPIWIEKPCEITRFAMSLILDKLEVAFNNINKPATVEALIKKLSSRDEIPTTCRNSLDVDEQGRVTDTPHDWPELVLDDRVKEVVEGACKGRDVLEYLTISPNVEKLGKEAFRGCKELKEVEIPSKLEYIGESCFRDCIKLKKLVIHGRVEIGERAFENCSSLSEIILSDDLAELPNGIFNSCKELKQLTLPKELEAICDSAFASCDNLKEIIIPEGVKRIDDLAFAGCSSLERVVIPNTVTRIGKNVFKDCSSLKEIFIPASVTKMDPGCFRGCKNLEKITVDEDNREYFSEDGIMYSNSLKLVAYPAGKKDKEFRLPRSVQGVMDWAFSDAQNLEVVSMEQCKGLTTIGEGAFFNCDKIKKLIIPRSVNKIQDTAFRDCAGLKALVVKCEALSELGWGTLYTCTKSDVVVYTDTKKFIEYCEDYGFEHHPLSEYHE